MRVLVATGQWFPDAVGGSARVATDTVVHLARRGHEITVIAPRVRGLPRESVEEGVRVRRVLARTRLPLTWTDVAETRRHAARLGRGRFDLAVAHQSTGGVGLSRARLGIPLALVFHASARRELRFLRSRLPPGPRRLATYGLEPSLALLERSAVRRAERILVLSEFSRSLIEADHPGHADRVRLVPGGVDVRRFDPGEGRDAARGRVGVAHGTTLLLTVRRLEPRMGIEQLLHALCLLHRPAVGLAVVGAGSLAPRLRALARELGIAESVRFVGRVTEQELREWYRAADLFVLPTVAYEGFGLATAESLASGTPVVGTPVGATPELLAPLDRRLIARGSDAGALAAAIGAALAFAGPVLREACRAYAERRFSWERVIDAWEEALLECARARRPVLRRSAVA